MSNTLRRETISDNLITEQIFYKLLNYTLANVKDQDNISQVEVVNLLLPKKISNLTISKVVNVLIPNAKATAGSIASLVRHIKNKHNLIDELLQDIGEDF